MDVERYGEGSFIAQATAFGDLIWLSGAVTRGDARDQSVVEEARDIFEQIDLNLAVAGSSRDRLLFVNIWLSRMSDWNAVNTVWMEWLEGCPKPARATVSSELMAPFGIEISAVAARTPRRLDAQT